MTTTDRHHTPLPPQTGTTRGAFQTPPSHASPLPRHHHPAVAHGGSLRCHQCRQPDPSEARRLAPFPESLGSPQYPVGRGTSSTRHPARTSDTRLSSHGIRTYTGVAHSAAYATVFHATDTACSVPTTSLAPPPPRRRSITARSVPGHHMPGYALGILASSRTTCRPVSSSCGDARPTVVEGPKSSMESYAWNISPS